MPAEHSDARIHPAYPLPPGSPEVSGLEKASGRAFARLWQLGSQGLRVRSEVTFALACSLCWTLLYNVSFWHQTAAALWHPAPSAVLFFLSLFAIVVTVQASLLLAMPTRVLMKSAASLLFLVAAPTSYFVATYNAVMNKDMMRNVLQTDRGEVHALLNPDLFLHILVLGVLPAVLVWFVRFPDGPVKRRVRQQAAFVVSALALSVAGLFACSANYAVFLREHKPLRFALSPLAPVASLTQLAAEHRRYQAGAPLLNPEGRAERVGPTHAKPLVVFLVIGETARAANFQLDGYSRPTTPRLAATEGLVYFPRSAACGTSTAISVPCLFSPLDRRHFVVEDAEGSTNLLDSLVQAGFDVEWRDNNAGCKGVCTRVKTQSYGGSVDASLCPDGHCYDEIMLRDLPERLRDVQRDTVIVFHQNGSHGPAYSERYPPAFEKFTPACHSNELHRCSPEEVINAYDNTIAYTDYVVSQQIELLRERSGEFDSVLLYVSDHGESLGEQGLYLHGLPYSFAPAYQTQVPMLLWTSSGYRTRAGIDTECLRREANQPHSQDDVYHTVLGAAETRNRAYSSTLDILSACHARPQNAE